jgi:hypothetical protein
MMRYRIQVSSGGGSLEGTAIRHWHLDGPPDGFVADASAMILLRGWAAAPLGVEVFFVLKSNQLTRSYPCLDPRQDVVDRFANAQPPLPLPARCGFLHEIPVLELLAGVQLGFETRGRITWVSTLTAIVSDLD